MPRTYRTPPDSAGVAMTSSPIGLVPIFLNSRPAATTMMSPSSLVREMRPSAATGDVAERANESAQRPPIQRPLESFSRYRPGRASWHWTTGSSARSA
jgi:hypothetical protein